MKESENLELKKSTSELKEAAISIASILNKHQRGEVYFGVGRDGKIVGQMVTENTLREVSRTISERIEPKIFPKVNEVVLDDKKCVHVEFTGNNVPYYAYGRAYIRVGDEDRQLSAKELEKMILEKNKDKFNWDEEICEGSSYDDIDIKKVKRFLKEREKSRNVSEKIKISIKELLTNLKCLKSNQPTNAGILFFGKDPLKFISHAQLRLIRIKGVKIYGDILDRMDCEGTLWEMVEQAEEFLRKNIRLLGFRTEKSFRREDKFDYPIKALREAAINALIHRDYFNPADVRVLIMDNRIEIINPGSFPEGVTPEKPEHKPVNKILSDLMYNAGFIEKYGSGIYLENELCLENGNEKPIYDISANQTKVTFKSQVTELTVVEIKEDVLEELNERQRKVIKYLKVKGKITTKEYVKLVKTSLRTARRDLVDLKDKQIIIFLGAPKTGYYHLRGTVSGTVSGTGKADYGKVER